MIGFCRRDQINSSTQRLTLVFIQSRSVCLSVSLNLGYQCSWLFMKLRGILRSSNLGTSKTHVHATPPSYLWPIAPKCTPAFVNMVGVSISNYYCSFLFSFLGDGAHKQTKVRGETADRARRGSETRGREDTRVWEKPRRFLKKYLPNCPQSGCGIVHFHQQ